MNHKIYRICCGIIILLGVFLRFYQLDERPFHHDESLHAYYSYLYDTTGEYRYNPMMHGPFLFLSNALVYRILGDTDLTARLLPACFGIILIILAFGFKSFLGEKGALFTGFFIAISPSYVYFSRFIRNDIYIATFAIGILWSILKYLETRKPKYAYLATLCLSLSFCSKENTYFVAFSFVSFGVLRWLIQHWKKKDYFQWLKNKFKTEWAIWGTCFFIFWIIYLPFYTVFFNYYEDWNGFAIGLKYWFEQHQEQRIGAPWWYYLPFMGLYEFLPAFLGVLAVIQGIRTKEKNPIIWFLIYWFFTSFILYSYAGEKVPWLMVHIILPLFFLSGWYLGKKCDSKKWLGPGIALILVALTLNATCMANFRYPALYSVKNHRYPHAEPIAYVQTTYDIPRLVDNVENIVSSYQSKGEPCQIIIMGEATWPLTWYFRDLPDIVYSQELGLGDMTIPVVITDLKDFETDRLWFGNNYDYEQYQLRAWWPQPTLPKNTGLLAAIRYLFQEATPAQLIRFFLFREIFLPGGSTDIIMWVKQN